MGAQILHLLLRHRQGGRLEFQPGGKIRGGERLAGILHRQHEPITRGRCRAVHCWHVVHMGMEAVGNLKPSGQTQGGIDSLNGVEEGTIVGQRFSWIGPGIAQQGSKFSEQGELADEHVAEGIHQGHGQEEGVHPEVLGNLHGSVQIRLPSPAIGPQERRGSGKQQPDAMRVHHGQQPVRLLERGGKQAAMQMIHPACGIEEAGVHFLGQIGTAFEVQFDEVGGRGVAVVLLKAMPEGQHIASMVGKNGQMGQS